MFRIKIEDDLGKILEVLNAETYMVIAQDGDRFTKAFSHNDLVLQLGLLEFAKNEVVVDRFKQIMNQPAGNVKINRNLTKE